MADDDLNTRDGVLGMQRDFGTGHKAIMKATKTILDTFCTADANAPSRCDSRESRAYLRKDNIATFDAELAAHMRKITQVLTTDAARDEMLAGEDLSPQLLPMPRWKCLEFIGFYSSLNSLSVRVPHDISKNECVHARPRQFGGGWWLVARLWFYSKTIGFSIVFGLLACKTYVFFNISGC